MPEYPPIDISLGVTIAVEAEFRTVNGRLYSAQPSSYLFCGVEERSHG